MQMQNESDTKWTAKKNLAYSIRASRGRPGAALLSLSWKFVLGESNFLALCPCPEMAVTTLGVLI